MDRKSAMIADAEKAAEKAEANRRQKEHVNDVARRINAICLKFGLSQKDLARITGVSYSVAGNWLNGNNGLKAEEASKLCAGIGISLDWVYLGNIINMNPQLAVELSANNVPLPKERAFPVDRSLQEAREKRKEKAAMYR